MASKRKLLEKTEGILTHIILICASIYAVFPMLWILSTSFKKKENVFSNTIELIPKIFTFENYRNLIMNNDYIFLTWLKNSVIIAVVTTLVGVFLAASAAYAFSRFKFPGRKAGLFSFLVAQMFPGALLIVPLYNLMKHYNLLNSYTGLILAYTTVALPFCVWMLKGFFDTIPEEIEDAAKVDGLNIFGTFYRIVVPLSLPGLAVTSFYCFITAWNEFMFALTFMNQDFLYTLPVGLQTFVNTFNTEWHMMAAFAIVITIPVMIFFLKIQTYIVSGLTAGSTKG